MRIKQRCCCGAEIECDEQLIGHFLVTTTVKYWLEKHKECKTFPPRCPVHFMPPLRPANREHADL